MSRDFHKSNPTGIVSIPKSRVTVISQRDNRKRIVAFSISSVSLEGLGFPDDAEAHVVIYDGLFEKRVSLGVVREMKLPTTLHLDGIDPVGSIIRLLVRRPGSPRLLGSCERIKAENGGDEKGQEALLPIEYEDLKQQLWEVSVSQTSRPVLKVNDSDSLGLKAKLEERDPFVRGMVLGLALVNVLTYMLYSESLETGDADWTRQWWAFLDMVDAPEKPQMDGDFDLETADRWAKEVANFVAQKWRLVDMVRNQGNEYD